MFKYIGKSPHRSSHTSLFINSTILESIPFSCSSIESSVSANELFLGLDNAGRFSFLDW